MIAEHCNNMVQDIYKKMSGTAGLRSALIEGISMSRQGSVERHTLRECYCAPVSTQDARPTVLEISRHGGCDAMGSEALSKKDIEIGNEEAPLVLRVSRLKCRESATKTRSMKGHGRKTSQE